MMATIITKEDEQKIKEFLKQKRINEAITLLKENGYKVFRKDPVEILKDKGYFIYAENPVDHIFKQIKDKGYIITKQS